MLWIRETHLLRHFLDKQNYVGNCPSGIDFDYLVSCAVIYRYVLIYAWGDFAGIHLHPLTGNWSRESQNLLFTLGTA